MADQLQERKINNQLKRLLKTFKQYKLTNTIDDALLLLLFDKDEGHKTIIILIDDDVRRTFEEGLEPNFIPYFLKLKNKRNSRNQAMSNVDKGRFVTRK